MSAPPRKHLLLLPAPFYGFYIPMLEFAKKAVSYHDITVMLMQSTLDDLEEHDLLPPPPIRWVPFRDNVNFEAGVTRRSDPSLMAKLGHAYRVLVDCLPTKTGTRIPASTEYDIHLDPVDVVMFDRYIYSIPGACNARKIPHFAFCFSPPMSALNMLTLTNDSPSAQDLYLDDSDLGKHAKQMCIEGTKELQHGRGLILNCYEAADEHTPALLKKVKDIFKPPIYFVGPLFSPLDEDETDVGAWLDRQEHKSVIYFSFGNVLSNYPEQRAEIGEALLKLKRPFIWSLHKDTELQREMACDDIELRSNYLILPWVNQKEVLSHPATAVFVSHCGYNSIIESANYGVPIVGWPLSGDEHVNAEYVERRGYGKCLEGTHLDNGRTVAADEIVQFITEVAGWDSDKAISSYGHKARELQTEIRKACDLNGPSSRQFLTLMQDIGNL